MEIPTIHNCYHYRYFKSQWAMPISYDFEFYDTFNYQIMKIKESGVLQFIMKSYENKYRGIKRTCENPKRQKGSPIDMYTIIILVIFFIGGICSSILFLLIENCWKFVKQKQEGEHVANDCSESANSTSLGLQHSI